MSGMDKESLLSALNHAKSNRYAVPAFHVNSFLEAESVAAAACMFKPPGTPNLDCPIVLSVSCQRKNLASFVKALRCLDLPEVFLQLTGDDPGRLTTLGKELKVDALLLKRADLEAARELCEGVKETGMVSEITLPWKESSPDHPAGGSADRPCKARESRFTSDHPAGGRTVEGRVVDLQRAPEFLSIPGADIVSVPAGGRPGCFKAWRNPLWSLESFSSCRRLHSGLLYSLPWGSLLPKKLIEGYNLYGGALAGIVPLPKEQLKSFVNAGAEKVNFRTDPAIAFLYGLRKSLYQKPEIIDLDDHLADAQRALKELTIQRLKDIGLEEK